ncbi:MAG: DUF2281 domain-containing protein [Tildeniella nuda ZEHNDER 1965/U140]|nr:DUF2281 domain-containing protein [Tildeniella nuda ZEHNDER 1965/U140]
MTIRERAIAKLQQLPEPLLQEISDFIDLIAYKYQAKVANHLIEDDRFEAWAQWFEVADSLEITPTTPTNDYQQRLLNKYRQQGLNL